MKLKPHPRYNIFKTWFDNHADGVALGEEVYRVAGPRHTTAAEIVSGTGAFFAGGRWNAPQSMNVVYLSRAPETAVHESNEHRRYYRLPLWEAMPKVMVAVRVDTEHVLDLTDPVNSASLPETMPNLMAEDWRAVMGRGDEPTAQAMGRAAFEAGLQGLVVPSKPDPNGANLLIFPDRLGANCRLEVLNAGELEKLGRPS